MQIPNHPESHAIVMGGSITGLLAGRVLANHFRHVTIIERDTYPAKPNSRPGVPQSRFLHVLLQRGQLILEELFPGLTQELVSKGVPLLKDCEDIAFYSQYGAAKKEASRIEMLSPTRGLLDWTIRDRLRQRKNLSFLEGSQVTGLIATPNRTGIAGVEVQTQQGANTLLAELVVDASGKTSKTPQWFQRLGYEAPPETLIDAHIGYAHRFFQRPKNWANRWQAVVIWPNQPEHNRAGILYPVEGDLWIVGLGGAAPELPPTDEAGYLDYARTLASPEIYEAIKSAKPVSDIYLYCGNENRRRAYEKLSSFPDNFLVMGHAACAFNPVYAQGMTMAAIEAQLLDRALQKLSAPLRPGWNHTLQRQFSQAEDIPWAMATEMDQRCIQRNQPQSILARFQTWYQNQFLQLATQDSEVYRRMMLVTHMLKTPSSLLAPSLLWKVWLNSMRTHTVPYGRYE
ncbi:MAG: FAD-dependent monooxygenase [Cyanobacteria bacterium J06634_5]